MEKRIKKHINKYIGIDIPMKQKLSNIMFAVAFIGGIVTLAETFVAGLPIVQIITISISLAVLILCMYAANYKNRLKESAIGIIIILSFVMFPIMFFTSGGLYGGMSFWFLVAMVFTFMMVESRICYLIVAVQAIVDILCYVISYCWPQTITAFEKQSEVYVDVINCMFVTTFIIGIIIRFQTRVYNNMLALNARQNEELMLALDDVKKQNEIISAIGRIYHSIYTISIANNHFEEITEYGLEGDISVRANDTPELMKKIYEKDVDESYKETMNKFFDMSDIDERFSDKIIDSIEFLSSEGRWLRGNIIVRRKNDRGSVTHILYVVQEIDAIKKKELNYQRELLKSAEDAKNANEAKSKFLSHMSHDMRTPINGIRGMINVAYKNIDNKEKVKECIGKMDDASDHLLTLINDVLDMSKLESGEVELVYEAFDIRDIIKCCEDMISSQLMELGISFSKNIGNLEHCYLVGSKLHIRQIIINILSNSVKYNHQGGSVTFNVYEKNVVNAKAVYVFEIKDTGLGMSREFVNHIFEPFTQEDSGARTHFKGTGLGMSIVKELIEKMDGTISIDSEQGVGSTFVITIPFEIDTFKESYVPEELCLDKKADISDMNILLVEDNELNLEVATFLLEENGAKVVSASNGKEAIEKFAASDEWTYDMILMDIMMPVMDGITATKQIRMLDRPDAVKIPILAMTANAFAEDVKKVKQAGMNDHIPKPLEANKVLNTIAHWRLINKG